MLWVLCSHTEFRLGSFAALQQLLAGSANSIFPRVGVEDVVGPVFELGELGFWQGALRFGG